MVTRNLSAAEQRSALKAAAARTRLIGALLRRVFGVEQLRPGQRLVIDSVLEGRNTLAIMPTGSGKSLCYQIPASILPGCTVVVSPLISLMQDQLEKLEEIGISAAQVNSSLPRAEELEALDSIRQRSSDIVFCTPERLAQPEFLQLLQATEIDLIVIDEAHCISQWGHDFRPAYLEIGAAVAALGRPPVLALTATATADVIADIGKQLGVTGMNVINTGIYRPNLRYSVVQSTNPDEKNAQALALVRQTPGVGIVYTATVKAAEELHALLDSAGESVALYHGKLAAQLRRLNQELFMSGERRVMVATNAFGMGIDKGDVRFVIHLQVPANLEAYYQESGRAGRDGEAADCTLLYFQDDKRLQQFFLVKHYPEANELRAVYEAAGVLAQNVAITFNTLKAALDNVAAAKLQVCLKLLKDGKLMKQNRGLAWQLTGASPTPALLDRLARIYADKQERGRASLEQMVGYAQSGYCRWKLLLDYFADAAPGFEHCGCCDNCLAPPHIELAQDETFAGGDALAVEAVGPPVAGDGAEAPHIAIGSRVKVPKFDIGTVLSVEGDRVTIEFPENTTKTFMAEFVQPV
jgi:ATP-dependent DNA helicase RecQ